MSRGCHASHNNCIFCGVPNNGALTIELGSVGVGIVGVGVRVRVEVGVGVGVGVGMYSPFERKVVGVMVGVVGCWSCRWSDGWGWRYHYYNTW